MKSYADVHSHQCIIKSHVRVLCVALLFHTWTQRYIEEGQTRYFFLVYRSPSPILSRQPLPWNYFLTRPNSWSVSTSKSVAAQNTLTLQATLLIKFFVCSPIFLEIIIPFILPQLTKTDCGTDCGNQ